jgi:hypothetical protein
VIEEEIWFAAYLAVIHRGGLNEEAQTIANITLLDYRERFKTDES